MPTTHRTPNETFAGYTDLDVKVCPSCGVMYAAPARLFKEHERDGSEWYCPNGHSLVFTTTVDEKLRRAEEQLRLQRERTARVAAARDQAEADARAQKAAKTRFKNERDRERTRVSNGTCPCCNRTFKNLARHMAGQHPDFPPPEHE